MVEPDRAKTNNQILGGDASEAGGARRGRTDDLLLAKQALSQLSYGPLNAPEPQPTKNGGPRWT